ncbi:SDR family oxidoreductase [Histidinibacterium aquaticum]|uniref:SDR family oxidoreductase n=1 Tax=Histidinibacterium aquaticum TaxID=2613962 RepID=A0A5J5GKC1_9RHOB|nr:SDR family oxidoreductase [Histidinibacterium aquaticum]KAA9008719.1 SDR family oxidoreductase [Histidinibacterium aquaticum]
MTLSRRETLALSAAALAAAATGGSAARAQVSESGRALVTGCSSGFGRLTAETFARAGIPVSAAMREVEGRNAEAAGEFRDLAETEGLPIDVVEIDVTDDASVEAGVAAAQEAGPVEILVNNAGIGLLGPAEIQTPDLASRIFETNVVGYHRVSRACLPQMRERGRGYILHISSGLGRFLHPALTLYTATKHATEAIGEMMAYELAPFGLDVTIVQPGRFPTDFSENALDLLEQALEGAGPERQEAYARHLEVARAWATEEVSSDPQRVAEVLLELVSLPSGDRPLRRRATPGDRPDLTDAINEAVWDLQGDYLRDGPYGEWVGRVRD